MTYQAIWSRRALSRSHYFPASCVMCWFKTETPEGNFTDMKKPGIRWCDVNPWSEGGGLDDIVAIAWRKHLVDVTCESCKALLEWYQEQSRYIPRLMISKTGER